MNLPLVSGPSDDPGPSFAELLPAHRASTTTVSFDGHRSRRADVPPRHHLRRRPLRRRRAAWPATAGPPRATSSATARIEKVFPADRHSGVAIAGAAGPGDRDGQALPAPARALREGRGRAAQPRGQGQPARPDDPQQPARRHAGPGRRADLRGLRPAPRRRAASSSTTSPAAATRRPTTPAPARAASTPAPC